MGSNINWNNVESILKVNHNINFIDMIRSIHLNIESNKLK